MHYALRTAFALLIFSDHCIRGNDMHFLRIFLKFIPLIGITIGLTACGGGNGNANTPANQQALIDEINNRFPYDPNQPLDQLFICTITGSVLIWYLDFHSNSGIDLYTTLDTGQNVFRTGGSYTHQNNTLAISMVNDVVNLNETSNQISVNMGMITSFTTSVLDCETYGHRYNAGEFSSVAHYQCPISNIQAVSDDENAVEFVHSAVPFSFAVSGSSFRQRDRNVAGMVNPLIQRGFGIYRRDGNRMYAYFARNQFDDFAYLSGDFGNADSTLTLDQTVVAGAACNRT
jgi:hypothetical protein